MLTITGGNILLDVNLILDRIHVKNNIKIADLGCGSSGHFVFPVAEKIKKAGTVFAVDILKTIIDSIRRRVKQENFKNIKTVWSDLEVFGATKIESGSLDVALLINTLYQSKNRAAILRETIRMLKKGGQMIVVDWKNSSLVLGPAPTDQVKEDLLINVCQKLGMKLEEEFIAGQYHYGLVFGKM